jgi:ABC-2 type transport system permease protein
VNKYIVILKKSFKSQMIYKSAVFSGMISTVLSFCIQVCLWKALLQTELSDGTSFEDMIFYVLVKTFVSILTRANISSTIEAAILDGSILTELLKPISYKYNLLATILGKNIYNTVTRFIPVMVIGMLIISFKKKPEISMLSFFLFIVALALGILIMFEITYLFGLLAFKIQRCWFLRFYIDAFTKFFGGTAIPLWFYPYFLQKISCFLPFQYITFIPVNIILNRISMAESLLCILAAFLWLLILNVLDKKMWHYATRNLTINGG